MGTQQRRPGAAIGPATGHCGGGLRRLAERRAAGRLPGPAPPAQWREGGLMQVVSRIAGGLTPGEALDGVIFLMDPVDPSSTFPEAQALKRQCVTHGKPFVPTLAGALEWVLVEALGAGLAPGRLGSAAVAELDPADQTLALIAHDARKSQMVDFAGQHFDLLSRFES